MFRNFFQGFNNNENGVMDVDEIPPSQPETGIIFISAHGGVITRQIEGISKPKMVRIPDTMEVIKISVATPGVVNLAHENDIVEYYNLIVPVFQDLSNPDIPISELQEIINQLIEKFQLKFNKIAKRNIKFRGLDHVHDFQLHTDKALKVFYLNPGEFIADKEYLRTESDIATDVDFRVLSLSREHGREDLLSKNNDEITTEEIMEHFLRNGTRRLIIFDFSCSTCSTYSERDTRSLRRKLIKDDIGYGGKRTRRNKRKMKRNKKPTKTRATRNK